MSGEAEAELAGDISWRSVLSAPALDPDFFTAAVGRALESSPAEADDELVPAPWPGDDVAGSDQPDNLDDPDIPDNPDNADDPDNLTRLSAGGQEPGHGDHSLDDLMTGLGPSSELGHRNGQVGTSGGPEDQPLPGDYW